MSTVGTLHPSLTDSAYQGRRAEIAALATGPGRQPVAVEYTADEHATWAAVAAALAPVRDRYASSRFLAATARLDLPTDRVPQLLEVSARLAPLTGYRFEAVPGLVPKEEFFAHLAEGRFLSTQFVRHPAQPLYTPEPDVIHELSGHANALADPVFARLHRVTGRAMTKARLAATRQQIADVFWFSGEFGVVREEGEWKAYGAGLLSSVGELGWFADHATVRPFDPREMADQPYDITRYQPLLFGATSEQHVVDTVETYYDELLRDEQGDDEP